MTVAELIEELEYMDQDSEVRFASQPSWPFEYSISSVVEVDVDDSTPVVYLEEGSQLGYLPTEAKNQLMW
tara:strand:- start:276 stop:485 length:210 start_codon:yes stop_codon:yes gene_type:complete